MIIIGDFPTGDTIQDRGNVVMIDSARSGKSMQTFRGSKKKAQSLSKPCAAWLALSNRWTRTLSPAQKAFWNAPPAGFSNKPRSGGDLFEVGYCWYLSANTARLCLGLAPIDMPTDEELVWLRYFNVSKADSENQQLEIQYWYLIEGQEESNEFAYLSIAPRNQAAAPRGLKLTKLLDVLAPEGLVVPEEPDPPVQTVAIPWHFLPGDVIAGHVHFTYGYQDFPKPFWSGPENATIYFSLLAT